MFLPLRDALPPLRLPIVTMLLVAINVLVYVIGLAPADTQVEGSTRQLTRHDVWMIEYGAVPCEITGRCANQAGLVVVDGGIFDPRPRQVSATVDQHAPALTLVTSMFLHGGLLHLVFNLLFLWVFGNNIEDAMHRLAFLLFYLASGMAAGLAQVFVAPGATAPIIGASGAIAAVIGAYLLLYPRAEVRTLVFPPIVMWLPAWVVAGGWGVIQLVGTWRSLLAPGALEGGVAYMAHFTGFVVGAVTISFFAERRNPEYELRYGDDAPPDAGQA